MHCCKIWWAVRSWIEDTCSKNGQHLYAMEPAYKCCNCRKLCAARGSEVDSFCQEVWLCKLQDILIAEQYFTKHDFKERLKYTRIVVLMRSINMRSFCSLPLPLLRTCLIVSSTPWSIPRSSCDRTPLDLIYEFDEYLPEHFPQMYVKNRPGSSCVTSCLTY